MKITVESSAPSTQPHWLPRRKLRPLAGQSEPVPSSRAPHFQLTSRPLWWWKRLAPAASLGVWLMALLVAAPAADVTVSDAIVSLAASANGTKNYTFTDAASGQSVTVALAMTPFSPDPAAGLSLLDGDTRVGVGNPNVGGDGNLIVFGEGVNFAASLAASSAGVTASSIRFRIQGLGLRAVDGNPPLYWLSSATASNAFSLTSETVNALDTAGFALGGGNYSGRLGFTVDDGTDAQLSDAGTIAALGLVLNVTFTTDGTAVTPPLISSWFTKDSGKYARIYETTANATAGTTSTTWSRGTVAQTLPAYAGVQEVSSSASFVYVRTTGLGFHNMGPWYLDAGKSQLFPNLPGNTATLWRFPRTPAAASTPTLTSLGAIGYFVDGVAMFDGQDGYYWNGTAETSGPSGGLWNRDAFPEEGISFDPGNAHQEQTGTYHYHANPLALRWQLGDNVTYNSATKAWSESVAAPTKHSPILGWVKDGYPIYGPYGYSSPSNSSSGIRGMTTGYVLRNGQNGTVNLATTGRVTLPAWAARGRVRSATLAANEYGPGVTGIYTVGRYHEDYEYLGDVGQTQGVSFDLDEHNGRFCVTPEFPNGTYAYFMTINSSGTPVYPYNIGRVFYGTTSGGSVTSITETVTTNFVGGPNVPVNVARPSVSGGTVTLTWSAAEGGTYTVENRSEVNGTWTTAATGVAPTANVGSRAVTPAVSRAFYRVVRTALASYSTTAAGTGGGGGG
ncbi:MAG: YHYH protein, partial [Limisphaerales bacterium]